MLKRLAITCACLVSFISEAATTYSCDGCTNAQYENLAKNTTGEVFVYDLVKASLKRYEVVLVTPAADSPTGKDIKSIVHLTPAKADTDFIKKASKVRNNATSITGNSLVFHANVSIANEAAFKDLSVYDIARSSRTQRAIGEELLYGTVDNPDLQDAVDVINDAAGNFISVVLKHEVVLVFKVELGDGGEAIFIISTRDINQVPDFDIENSSDSDGNAVITGNHSSQAGDYTFTTQANLSEFLTYLERLGVPVVSGGSTGTWGCTPSESGVICKFIN